jgi:hypothetical protein
MGWRRHLIALIALVTALSVPALGRVAAAPQSRQAIVVELFTSEGCSSCPPADDLLRRLIATQPFDGVQLVALGNHVDYWDHEGWRDPFSSAAFSKRQRTYDDVVFGGQGPYTPQLVVDGRYECVASNATAVRQAVMKAVRQPKGTLSVAIAPVDASNMKIEVRGELPPALGRRGAAEIVVALTEDGLVSNVSKGENGGRTLAHSAVVRLMTVAGRVANGEAAPAASTIVKLSSAWMRPNLHAVAFVQETGSRRILAAASVPFR